MPDMRLTSEERKDFSTPGPTAPKYPYGLKINLEPEQLEKLGIQDAPEIDAKMKFEIVAQVVSVNKDLQEEGDESSYSVSLQIVEMYLDNESKSDTDKLYGV